MDGNPTLSAAPAFGGVLPDTAPPILWTCMIVSMALWWLWPWLDRTLRPPPAPATSQPATPSSTPPPQLDASSSAQGNNAPMPDDHCIFGAAVAPHALNFDPLVAFDETFAEAVRILNEALDLPPSGFEYLTVTGALHRVAGVLDKLLQAWGGPDEEMKRVSSLREDRDAFGKHFGEHRAGRSARSLLQLAGFERHADDNPATWVFQREDAEARLKALTVKLCLTKHTDLQQLRGTSRWTQASNDAVVPKPEDASILELLGLYRQLPPKLPELATASSRERNLEVAVRTHLNDRRRSEFGYQDSLAVHEGLAGAARVLAQAQRTRVREARGDLKARRTAEMVEQEVRELLTKLPLPPGFHAAHLHFYSDELPHIFGLASSTGGHSAAGGKPERSNEDQSAEILAAEAVGFWAVRQPADVAWPCAAIIGVGASLDYTINRGFVVALLAGVEGVMFEGSATSSSSGSMLRKLPGAARRAAAAKAQAANAPAPGCGPTQKPGFGARVHTLDGEKGMHKK